MQVGVLVGRGLGPIYGGLELDSEELKHALFVAQQPLGLLQRLWGCVEGGADEPRLPEVSRPVRYRVPPDERMGWGDEEER